MEYKIFKKAPAKSVKALIALSKEVSYKYSGGSNTRIGANKERALSIYGYSKWLRWNRHQRQTFKDAFMSQQIERATQVWFLTFPAGDGFLDVMDAWVNDPFPASIVSMSLKDGQKMIFGSDEVTVNKGEYIAFRLSTLHSVPKSDVESVWACTMSRVPYESLEE